MLFLRQSTASQEILLGPFVDSTDGNTQETALSIANTDIKVWKEGGTTEASKNSGGATHIASGRYYAVLDATDTDTVGKLEVNVHVTGALAVRREFMVLEEAVYDALFAASAAGYQVPIWASAGSTVNLSATTIKTATDVETDTADIQTRLPAALVSGRMSSDVIAISGDTVAADNAESFFDGTGYAGTGNVIPTVTTVTTATNVTTVNGLAAGVITAASIAADAITDAKVAADVTIASVTGAVGSVTGAVGSVTGAVGSVTGNVGGNVVGSVGSVTGAVGSVTGAVGSVSAGGITAASIATGAVDADALATDAVTEIVTAILTTAMTESYNTDGAAPTLTQALMLVLQILSESSVAATTLTVKKLDGSTTAATFTLSDATTPTSITRAS